MRTINISLNSVDKVKNFVSVVSMIPGDIDIRSGRYIIDAKSIMGIFSLDLSRPLTLVFHDDGDYSKCLENLTPFIL